jgi:predicted TIM-barrel fold metal-dependent hydrolase
MAIGSDEWLDQVREDVVEPDLKICDPHHHLWDHPDSRYLLDELLVDIGDGHRVVSTVFVECSSMYRAEGEPAFKPIGETEFVNGIAAMSASGQYGEARACAGIVSFADLMLGADVGRVLDAHMAISDRFKGIRHAAGWDASDAVRNSHTEPFAGMLGDARFLEGFAELGKRGLSFDAWLYHPQLGELKVLAERFPDTVIILDHLGGPLGIGPYAGKRDEIYPVWKRDIQALARCENVVAKLGGMVMPINGFGFHKRERPPGSDEIVAATGDYYRHMLECFGAERCMFESNFPVDKQSCSYRVLWNAFKKLVADASAAEKSALFHDTATRVYRL